MKEDLVGSEGTLHSLSTDTREQRQTYDDIDLAEYSSTEAPCYVFGELSLVLQLMRNNNN